MFKHLLAYLLAAGLSVLANPVQADSSASSGAEGTAAPTSEGWGVGLRASYAVPQGKMFGLEDLNTGVDGVLKPQLELTYGLNTKLVFGIYFALGGGFQPNKRSKEGCDLDDVQCQILLLESGLFAEYRFMPRSRFNPWGAVNLGVDRFSSGYQTEWGEKSSIKLLGVGFGSSLGVDAQFGDVAFGPFFALQVGRYMRSSTRVDDNRSEGSIDKPDRTYHCWLNFGLRVRYQFRP
jgi:hypothetical protein